MPNGPNDGKFRCKKCNSVATKFTTIDELRRDQWAAHRDAYANTIKAAKQRHKPPRGWRKRQGEGVQRYHREQKSQGFGGTS